MTPPAAALRRIGQWCECIKDGVISTIPPETGYKGVLVVRQTQEPTICNITDHQPVRSVTVTVTASIRKCPTTFPSNQFRHRRRAAPVVFLKGAVIWPFNVAGQISEDSAKLVLSGDIDLQVSGDIKTEIERLSDISRLEIDASEVTYIDSSGVAVLILARQHCTRNNMTLALPSISEAVHRVLQIAKLDVMLPIGEVVSAPEPEDIQLRRRR